MAQADTPQDSAMETVPGTPGIREVRTESGSETFRFSVEQPRVNPSPGIRKVNLRAEIDTSPPFGSVKEAVTRFGGHGSWVPFYNKFGEAYNENEEFDIKKVEEQAAELEKDLIVKELETLDVLEELGTTKRIVEELKRQLQQEALKCMATPDFHSDIKEMNEEHCRNIVSNQEYGAGNLSPCPASSPDLILMELKKAKLNLGKTINDLGVIQTSVESLNKKMMKEKTLLEKTRQRLTSKFAGVPSLEEELKQMRVKPQTAGEAGSYAVSKSSANISRDHLQTNPQREQIKKVAEPTKVRVSRTMPGNEPNNACIRTAEMRWVAARKMEDAARAAEALAIAEMKALSNNESSSGFFLPEPMLSPLRPKAQKAEKICNKRVLDAMHQFAEASISKLSILKKMEEATAEVKYSKQALEEALNRIDIANRKQLAAQEALQRWMPENDQKGHAVYDANKLNHLHPADHNLHSYLGDLNKSEPVNDEPKPVLRPTVSMRDILSRKQVQPEECSVKGQGDSHTERRKVALSQMLQELREDLRFPTRAEKDVDDQKQFFAQRRKFGFIHISLPLAKQSKKKPQALNTMT